MKKNDDLADLDAYDQGRIDTKNLFMKALEEGYKQAKSKEELFKFMIRQMDLSKNETEGRENEPI